MATLPTPLVLPTPKPDHSATRPPPKNSSSLRMFLWRQRMWFESTFVLSMLEPWEKVLLSKSPLCPGYERRFTSLLCIVTILGFFCFLVISGLFKYLPHHLDLMQRRAAYYLWGKEGDPMILWQLGKGASKSVRRLFQEL